jgi:hypothetical protein
MYHEYDVVPGTSEPSWVRAACESLSPVLAGHHRFTDMSVHMPVHMSDRMTGLLNSYKDDDEVLLEVYLFHEGKRNEAAQATTEVREEGVQPSALKLFSWIRSRASKPGRPEMINELILRMLRRWEVQFRQTAVTNRSSPQPRSRLTCGSPIRVYRIQLSTRVPATQGPPMPFPRSMQIDYSLNKKLN